MTNRLAHETSPYLLQHAHNPVDWYPWGEEAFATARATGKPILLSIGYSACHWCHVMERECFENPAIARLMNELFVNVKVDREERPDVDDVYMKAVQLLTGHGGWPLTVFLTPEGRPFHGGTYFPPTDRHGLPGFPRVLEAVARAYRERPDDVARASEQLLEGIVSMEPRGAAAAALDATLPRRAAEALLAHVDWVHGGLGGAPKFPHPQALQLFLRQYAATGRREYLEAVQLTCVRMATGGVYDQIGGGFHRYAVDQRWLVPHFEKMLYDNAQLPRLYLDAYLLTGDAELRRIAEETLDYVLRDLRHPAGAFFSATDADSEGEEGRYFLWTPAEVAAVVGPEDAELVCAYWDITPEGNFEGRSIPHPVATPAELGARFGRSPEAAAAAIARARARLLEARAKRVPPLRDEKIIAGWNGLMIGSLAQAGLILGERRFVDAAVRAADFLWRELREGTTLLHTWAAGRARNPGYLDDHALLAAAFVDLYEATGARTHLERARALAAALDARFHDAAGGGFFFTPHDGEPLVARAKPGADGATPGGNAAAALVLLRLHHLTGEDWMRARAEEVLRLFHDAAASNPFAYATYLEALELWAEGPTEVVIVGARDAPDTRALGTVAAATYLPHRVLVLAEPGAEDPPAPARGLPAVDGRATAYVCRRFTCSAPVTEPEALRALLTSR
jgi:uncharacterized protein YyaL (SSP411 family)